MRKFIKFFTVIILIIVSMVSLVGCGRDGYVIDPNESAFVIPYTGNTLDGQSAFSSEEFLAEKKVAGKRIIIEKEYVWGLGNQPVSLLIKVNRAPVTREWTESVKTGTNNKNQGITAESKESIGFMARFNCTALIEEKDAALYLYRYPSNLGLSEIMDSQIRTVVEGEFTKECSKKTMDEIISSKPEILQRVNDNVVEYFKKYGISVTILSYKGEFTYLDKDIQERINKKFKSANDLITQKNLNEKAISKAAADNIAIKSQNETIQYTIKLKELENQTLMLEKWDGKLPVYSGGDANNLISLPAPPTGKK